MKLLGKFQHNCRHSAALALAATMLAFVAGATAAKAETLVLGTVGKDLKSEMKEHESLAKYL